MTIHEIDIPLTHLIPIQHRGISLPHLSSLDMHGELPPVSAVRFNDVQSLLVDGTHRAYRAHLLGNETIRANLAVDDEGVRTLAAVALAGCNSLSDVHDKYRTFWLPLLQEADIDSIAKLPVRTAGR